MRAAKEAHPGAGAVIAAVVAIVSAASPSAALQPIPGEPDPAWADSLRRATEIRAAADSAAAAPARFDSLAPALASPARWLLDALARTPGAVTLPPRAVTDVFPVSAADFLEQWGLAEMIPTGAPAGMPEWISSGGLGPGWIGLAVDGLPVTLHHAAAPDLDASPLEPASAFLWVPGPLAALAGTGSAGGYLGVTLPDRGPAQARSVVATSLRYYGTNTGAVSFESPGARRGFAFHYSDRSTSGREAYLRSWVREFGGRVSASFGDSLRIAAWGRGLDGRARVAYSYDDQGKLERRGTTAAVGATRGWSGIRGSLTLWSGAEEAAAFPPDGTHRRRSRETGLEAAARVRVPAAVMDVAGGVARGRSTWREAGIALPDETSTRQWGVMLSRLDPWGPVGAWAGLRVERESGQRLRWAPAAAVEWRRGGGTVWAAVSRGYGNPAYPTYANDLRTLVFQGLGLLDRETTVELPSVGRAEIGAGVADVTKPSWCRLTLFASHVRNAFVGDDVLDAGAPSGWVASGALDSLRGGADLVGIDVSGRLALPWGFHVRGRGTLLRDADGGEPRVFVDAPGSALAALGHRRSLFDGGLLATAELIVRHREPTTTVFARLDRATIVSFRATGEIEKHFHIFYQADNLLRETAGSRTFVPDVAEAPIFLPGRNFSFGVLWRLLD